jgi:hypothetical protein
MTEPELLEQVQRTLDELAKTIDDRVLNEYKMRYDNFKNFKEKDKSTVETLFSKKKKSSKNSWKWTDEDWRFVIRMKRQGLGPIEIGQKIKQNMGFNIDLLPDSN